MEGQKKKPLGKTRALFDFNAENEGELSFKADDIIWVLDKDDVGEWDGWWEGRCERTKLEGFFPADGWVEELPFTPEEHVEPSPNVTAVEQTKTNPPQVETTKTTEPASPTSTTPAPEKPAIPSAPKPPVKARSSQHLDTAAVEKSTGPTISVTSPKEKEPAGGDDKDKPKTNKDKKDNNKTSKKDSSKDTKKAVKKPAPKRKAPKGKGKNVELSDPYGFKKVGGFERKGGQKPEEQIAKLYNCSSPEDVTAMIAPPPTSPGASPASPTSHDGQEGTAKKKLTGSRRGLSKEEKKQLEEEKKKHDEEKKRLEEEKKKKKKEEKKKSKEDAKKNNKEAGGEGKGKKGSHIDEKKNNKLKTKSSENLAAELGNGDKKPAAAKKEDKEEVLPPPSRIVKPGAPGSDAIAPASPKIESSPTPLPPLNSSLSLRGFAALSAIQPTSGDPLLDFLTALKLESLHSVFKDEEMEFPDDFIGISHEELSTLGIKMGPRRRIILAMQQFQSGGKFEPYDGASEGSVLDASVKLNNEATHTESKSSAAAKEDAPPKSPGRQDSKSTVQKKGEDEEGSSSISMPLKVRKMEYNKEQHKTLRAEQEINKLVEKGIKKEEGWVFPEDAAEEGVTPSKGSSNHHQDDVDDDAEGGKKEQQPASPPAVPPKLSTKTASPVVSAHSTNGDDAGTNHEEEDPQQEYHPYSVLTAKVLPEGVDKSKLEVYLSPDEFSKIFGITKKEFFASPGWRQKKLKQEKNLF